MTKRRVTPQSLHLPMLPSALDMLVRVENTVETSSDDLFIAPDSPKPELSAKALSTRSDFEAFAQRDDVPGALAVREVKFVITDLHTDTPQIYFMNSKDQTLHYYFVRDYLGYDLSISEFNRLTYFTDQRQFITGNVLAFDNYTRPDGTPGLYALEFWPTDPVSAQYVSKTYRILRNAMPFAAELIAYHPSGDIQETRFEREADIFAEHSIPTISTYELFEDIGYNPLNLGEAVGKLRLISASNARPPSAADIVIYETLPNDLPIVAGVLTSAPQTSLSHVNLRAQQNGIVNAYLNDAANHPQIEPLIGQIVWLAVNADGIEIRRATQEEATAFLEARRPATPQLLTRNLQPRSIVALDDLTHADTGAFGGKATGLAELRRTIDPEFVPNGFAVPFSFYDDFMSENGFYDMVQAEISKPEFNEYSDRREILKKIRRRIKRASLPEHMRDELDAMHKAFPPGTTPRCRSSANSEDLVGFTGAGLYSSYTHREDEGHIEKSIKQVWASLWNLRAYNEREFYRIDHMSAAMGVLVHPNFDDELVNGVALTKNIYFPTFEGYYISAQVGENLVTNPEDAETAEELLVMKDANSDNQSIYEKIYIRRSSLIDADEVVIGHDDLMLLVAQLKRIQSRFPVLYRQQNNDNFAMDVEFKFDKTGKLAIKQARPWISGT